MESRVFFWAVIHNFVFKIIYIFRFDFIDNEIYKGLIDCTEQAVFLRFFEIVIY